MNAYHDHLVRKGNKPGSITTSDYRLDAILDSQMSLIDLTPARAQHLYDDLVDEGGAVDTHRGCLISAKAFGRFVADQGWLKDNPFKHVQPVGRRNVGKEQLRVDEGRTFLAHCLKAWTDHGDRGAVAAMLGLLLSLRADEVAQLVARDVDDRGRLLWIAHARAKTSSSRRRAKVPAVLVAPLLACAAKPATEDGHLFSLEGGTKPADRHWVLRNVKRLSKAAGVTVITAHGLRGTHATLGTVQGTTGEAVAAALGHAGTAVTREHYIDKGAAADAQSDRVAETLLEDE